MKHSQDTSLVNNSQQPSITDLRLRGLEARKAFEVMGVYRGYMSIVDLQANKEGVVLDNKQRIRCRQLLNGNLKSADFPLLELIERAIAAQQTLYETTKEG
jgi:hypothetical protein